MEAGATFPRLVTGAQMRAIDQYTIDRCGISGVELMERAGARVVETIEHRFDGLQGLSVAVVCGKGNNGGDGLVAARRLLQAGVTVEVLLGVEGDAITGAAEELLQRLQAAGGHVQPLPADGTEVLRRHDVIIDALLGTGFTGTPRAVQAAAIEAMNQSGRPIVAVDLPSGVDADSGAVPGAAVRATVTVTFGLAKRGHLFAPGRAYCGALELVDIGFPVAAIEAAGGSTGLLTAEGVSRALPSRQPDAHKGTCGAVLVVAGSAGMSGAATLTADAALRVGSGRVTAGVPMSLHDIVEIKLTEVMTRPLPEVRRRRCLSLRALGEIVDQLGHIDALAIGPGLGRYRETGELVRRLLRRQDLPPTVLDADGLHAISGDATWTQPGLVLTPHAGEFSRLTGRSTEQIKADPVGLATEFAVRHQVIVVLKGGPTVIATPAGDSFVNPTGNPGMATAGSGDVLTGMIAGLLAQGIPAQDAACCGVYLHGLAGDRGRDELGEWGLRASDVLQRVPAAFVEVASGGPVRGRFP